MHPRTTEFDATCLLILSRNLTMQLYSLNQVATKTFCLNMNVKHSFPILFFQPYSQVLLEQSKGKMTKMVGARRGDCDPKDESPHCHVVLNFDPAIPFVSVYFAIYHFVCSYVIILYNRRRQLKNLH